MRIVCAATLVLVLTILLLSALSVVGIVVLMLFDDAISDTIRMFAKKATS